ncbi:MAG: type II secretion system major pseudopilin GspG [Pseudomonadota bacterium]
MHEDQDIIKSANERAKRKGSQAGVTLFELLVVLAILAFLATLIAPRVVGYLGRAKTDVARAQISNIAASLELYYLDLGRYPTTEEGLGALVDGPATAIGWRGPYFKDAIGLTDPWGRAYGYVSEVSGDIFEIYSLGRDGAEGGEGEDADIRAR